MEIYSIGQPYPGMTYPWQWWHSFFPVQPGMSPWTMSGVPGYHGNPGFQPCGGSPGFSGMGTWMGWPWSMMPSPGGQPGWPFSWTRAGEGTGRCRGCQSDSPYAQWTPWAAWWGVPPLPGASYLSKPTDPGAIPSSVRAAGPEPSTAIHHFDPMGGPLWESTESPESPWIRMPETENAEADDPADQTENG
jgi:hypothetical protein